MLLRACITCGRPCAPGKSRCGDHGGVAWAGQQATRQASYNDPIYKANRAKILEGHPLCHWCRLVPATTADHLIAVAQGGDHSRENLVPACEPCNRLRGASLGGQVTKLRRKQRGR